MRVRLVPLAAALLAPAALRAQARGFGPLVLQLPASARAIGFGDAYVGVREPEALFYNPANAGGRNALAASAERYGAQAAAGGFAASYAFGSLGLGIGAQLADFRVDVGNYPALAPNGERFMGDGPLAASSMVAAIGLARAIKGIRWGVAAKVAQDRGGTTRDGVVLADVGAGKEFGPASVGISVQNLGASPRLLGTSAALPTRATVGVAGGGLPVGPLDFAASAAVSVRRGGRVSPAGGVELGYVPIEGVTFAGRVGARLPENDGAGPLTLGATFTFDRLSIDYGFEPYQGKGSGHRVGLRVR